VKIGDGAHHDAAARYGQGVQTLHGGIPLLLLLRIEPFETFHSVEHAAALHRIHVVQAIELIEFTLLGCGIELMKAGLILQSPMLLSGREILVVFDPPGEMAFALRHCGGPHGGLAECGWGALLHPHGRPGLRPLDGPLLWPEGVSIPCKQED
jgi:hypothetical protein